MKRTASFFLTAVCSVFIFSPVIVGQTPDKNTVPMGPTYSQVVDRAFQFSSEVPAEFAGIEYRVVVRFMPSFGRESQFVFSILSGHAVRITEYRLKRDSPSVSAAYNELGRNPRVTVEDVLKRVSIEKVDRVPGNSADRLAANLFALSIPTNISSDLCMDGTTYQLWIQTSNNQIHTSFTDCSYGKGTASTPIFKWIAAVQKEFLNQPRD